MADKKISELDALTGANTADDDVLVIVDTSAGLTKKITLGELESALAERDFSFGDNEKLTFGAGSDLQIYHDGSHSYIDDAGSGRLNIRTNDLRVEKYTGETIAKFIADGAVELNYNDVKKLATTSTGVNVTGTVVADAANITGTVTADGLTVEASNPQITITDSDTSLSSRINYNTGIGSLLIESDTGATGSAPEILFRTATKNKMKIEGTGDISFYEDTGTTPKFFWDASAESLGIGTSSPSGLLQLTKGTRDLKFLLETTPATDDVGVQIRGGSGDYVGIASGTGIGIVVDSSNNVGIGTSSPKGKLDIAGDQPDLVLTATDTSGAAGQKMGAINFYNSDPSGDGPNNAAIIEAQHVGSIGNAANLLFKTVVAGSEGGDALEAMRIDSSGNLLVGTTDADPSNDTSGSGGIALGAAGYVSIGRADSTPLLVNRIGTGTESILFKKDGATVGHIGVYNDGANSPYFADQGNVGIRLSQASTDDILPCSSTGANRDAAINLGSSATRFKDLYLSGGVYLGGTGAANYLDDYEEGSVTLTMGGGTLNPLTTQSTTAFYTKVGDVVKLWFKFSDKNNTGASGVVEIDGLPFAVNGTQDGYGTAWGGRDSAGGTGHKVYLASAGTTSAKMIDGNGNNVTWASTGTGTFQGGFIVYKV